MLFFWWHKRWRRKYHISLTERTKFRKSRILLIFLHFQRAEHLLVMVGVGNAAPAKLTKVVQTGFAARGRRWNWEQPVLEKQKLLAMTGWKGRAEGNPPLPLFSSKAFLAAEKLWPHRRWRPRNLNFLGTSERVASRGDFQRNAVFCKCSVLKSQNFYL